MSKPPPSSQNPGDDTHPHGRGEDERNRRPAEPLRANLARRKSQGRARAAGETAEEEENAPSPPALAPGKM